MAGIREYVERDDILTGRDQSRYYAEPMKPAPPVTSMWFTCPPFPMSPVPAVARTPPLDQAGTRLPSVSEAEYPASLEAHRELGKPRVFVILV